MKKKDFDYLKQLYQTAWDVLRQKKFTEFKTLINQMLEIINKH